MRARVCVHVRKVFVFEVLWIYCMQLPFIMPGPTKPNRPLERLLAIEKHKNTLSEPWPGVFDFVTSIASLKDHELYAKEGKELRTR